MNKTDDTAEVSIDSETSLDALFYFSLIVLAFILGTVVGAFAVAIHPA